MCLYTKQHEFKVAEKDIVCWKVLEIVESHDGEAYVTPFAFVPVEDDVMSGKKLFAPSATHVAQLEEMMTGYKNSKSSMGVEKGVIHVYSDEKFGVLKMRDEMMYHINHVGGYESWIDRIDAAKIGCDIQPDILGISLWKCVIPKGTEYIKGSYYANGQHTLVSYGAKAIRFTEKVAEWRTDDGTDTEGVAIREKIRSIKKKAREGGDA